MYKQKDLRVKQPITVNKGKQQEDQVQNKEVFLYKPYDILSKFSKKKKLQNQYSSRMKLKTWINT